MKISLYRLHKFGPLKGPGFVQEVLAIGTITGDQVDVPAAPYAALCFRYSQWGDLFAIAAKPIARAAGLSENCPGCARRQTRLNGGAPPL